MSRLTLIVLAAGAVAGSAHAQQGRVTCQDLGFGNQTCRDSAGNQYRSYTDSFGNTTVRDSGGNTTRIHHDAFGGSTVQNPDGTVTRGQTDMFGNTTYRDQQGNQTRCRRQIAPLPGLPGQSTADCQ